MPTYVYECAKCGDEFELYQSFSDDPLKKHPGCGGKVAKVFQPVGIVLKGSGFYKNDSRSGAKRSQGPGRPSNGSEPDRSRRTIRLGVGESDRDSSPRSLATTASRTSKSESAKAVVDLESAKSSSPQRRTSAGSPRRRPFPRSSPTVRVAAPDLGKEPPCPDALPARSRSGAPPCGRGGDRRDRRRRPRRAPPARRRPRPRGRRRRRHPRPPVGDSARAADLRRRRCTGRSCPRSCSSTAPRRSGRGGARARRRLLVARATSRPAGVPGSTASSPRDAGDAGRGHRRARSRVGRGRRRARDLRPVRGDQRDGTTSSSPRASPCSAPTAGRGGHRAHGAAGVTLLVDPDQAAALADAQANGVVTLALVPPEERRVAHLAVRPLASGRPCLVPRARSSSGSSRGCPSSCRSRRAAT